MGAAMPCCAEHNKSCWCCAGLWDPHNDAHMGDCAELCATHYQISREEMDDHAIEAFQRAQAAAPYMQVRWGWWGECIGLCADAGTRHYSPLWERTVCQLLAPV